MLSFPLCSQSPCALFLTVLFQAKQSLAELFAQWLRHVYVGVFPTDTLARIWDCALMVGPKILLRVACLVVLCAAEDLLAATNAIQLVEALRKVAAEWSSPQALVIKHCTA